MLKNFGKLKYTSFCLIFLLVCVFSVLSQDTQKPTQEKMPEGLNIYPYLQNATQNGIVVMWETIEPITGTVNYGDSEEWKFVSDQSPAKIHEIKITGLEPGKLYRYQVSYGKIKIPVSTFKTVPPDGTKEFRLAVYGDSRSNPAIHSKVAKLMLDSNPDLVINTGDIVLSGNDYERWKNEFFMPLRNVIDHVPIYVTLGNHERNSPNYYNYLSLPNNESYYSFDYANAHFICLNTNSGSAPYDESSPQYKWLIDDLEKNKGNNKWLIVFFHAPLFRAHLTRGIEQQRYLWQPLFDKYGVDLVFNGHDHNYTRTYPIGYLSNTPKKGVYHIVSGGGGASLYDLASGRSYIKISDKVNHAIIMEFSGDNMIAAVQDANGKIIDRFEIDRSKTAQPDDYIAYEMFEIERDLRKAIDKLEPAVVANQKITINSTLSVKVNSTIKLEGMMFWNVSGKSGLEIAAGANTKWKFNSVLTNFEINPGGEFQIPIQASVNYSAIYPIPSLIIKFRGSDGKSDIGFRNNEMTVYPIKVLPISSVEITKSNGNISVDGKIDEQAWAKAAQLKNYVTVQGDTRQKNGLETRLTYDGSNLYISADVKSNPEKIKQIVGGNPLERDNKNIIRSENFNINLSDGEVVYNFIINPQGSQFDAKNGDEKWNLEWVGKVLTIDTGWIAEISIPVSFFGDNLSQKQWYINVGRWDSSESEGSMLVPTFNMTDRENRLPEYSDSTKNPKLFPKLIFKDLKPIMPAKTTKSIKPNKEQPQKTKSK
ncbi:MAG: metallophosphoesterase [Candidatus Poribacteria bacterium]